LAGANSGQCERGNADYSHDPRGELMPRAVGSTPTGDASHCPQFVDEH
jgi:hypothetical protein